VDVKLGVVEKIMSSYFLHVVRMEEITKHVAVRTNRLN